MQANASYPAQSVPFAPLTMPKPSAERGIMLAPMVGWYAACATCGVNLTQQMNDEYACWADEDGAGNDAYEATANGPCECGAVFGDLDDEAKADA
jgi:hypothetical protein